MAAFTHDRYVDAVRREATALRSAASPDTLELAVPSCPGWTVREVVEHTSEVYLHKAACMQRGRPPQPWPPDKGDEAPLDRFDAALAELLHELSSRDPAAFAAGWWPFDRSVGFWGRRMAQETLVHRVDVEQAVDGVTPLDDALAEDGVDEVLIRFLAGDWSDEPVAEAAGTVVGVRIPGRLWRVVLEPAAVVTVPDPTYDLPYAATVSGSPGDVELWAWGRGSADQLTVEGDPAAVVALRRRLAAATQ